jgi:hypothetical protein
MGYFCGDFGGYFTNQSCLISAKKDSGLAIWRPGLQFECQFFAGSHGVHMKRALPFHQETPL